MTNNRELRVEDFDFDGPLGCQGAEIELVGRNHFRLRPGHAPEHPDWANMVNFTIRHGARGNNPRMDVCFPGATKLRFNDYSYSWSYDGENWRAVHWEKGERDGAKGDTSDWSKRLSWGRGPHDQFDISSFLCEGAGNTYRREDCLAAGRALMQGIARYCL